MTLAIPDDRLGFQGITSYTGGRYPSLRHILMEGQVRKWVTSYGFISNDSDKDDIFVHESAVKGRMSLREGQRVKFDVTEEPRGLKATNVELIEED
jgi:CspA family cold shock protein